MKKEDFIIGKWYTSSLWRATFAAKFNGFTSSGYFSYLKYIKKELSFVNISGITMTDKQQWNTFREVSYEEYSKYLPEGDSDLQNNISNSRYVKLLPGFDTSKTGKIFDTSLNVPNYNNWSKSWTWNYLLTHNSHKRYFIPATREEYDAQFKLTTFPSEGYCLKSQELYDFLCKKYPVITVTEPSNKSIIYYAWNDTSFWSIVSSSSKPYYKLEQLNKFINNNQNNKNHEVSRTTSENTRPSISGTVAIRYGRQQITTGSRPNGNKTCASAGRTRFDHIKIIKTTIKRENY